MDSGHNKAVNLDYSVQFDARWWSSIPEIKHTADFLCNKFADTFPSNYKLSRLKNHLKVILTNLHVAHKANNKLYVAISLNKCSYKKSKRYPKLYLNYKYVSYLINILIEHDYIEFHKGINYENFKRCSRIKTTQKLLRLFKRYKADGGKTIRRTVPIILRDSNKNDIDFDINDLQIKEHLVNVNRINKCLSLHNVNCNVPDNEYAEFMKDYAKYRGMDKYTRIYNNSDFTQGGRFYRHWTQEIKSKFRKYITIDNMPTVELDYSCLHLSMLYGIEGLLPPEGDLYKLVGTDCKYRPLVKKAVNIIINAKSEREALQAIHKERIDFIQKYNLIPPLPKDILQAIRDTHPFISKYFCTNYGVKLQYLDSSIAENIMLDFTKDNIPCLCIHDSFIVSKQYQSRLHSLMIKYFQEYFHFIPNIK